VFPTAEKLEHLAGVRLAAGLPQDLSVAFRHRVASEDQSRFDPRGNVGRFSIGEARDKPRRLLGGFAFRFRFVARLAHFKGVTRFGEQLTTSRRPTCQDDWWLHFY